MISKPYLSIYYLPIIELVSLTLPNVFSPLAMIFMELYQIPALPNIFYFEIEKFILTFFWDNEISTKCQLYL